MFSASRKRKVVAQPTTTLDGLKAEAKFAIQQYYNSLDAFGGDCGAHMAAVINPEVGLRAREANRACLSLKAVDPNFPSTWTPFSEGN